MRLSGKTLLLLDRCFWLPHRLVERLRNSTGTLHKDASDQVVVVKFMGLGSLIQFASLCDEHKVDKTKILLVTLAQHRDFCRLFCFEKALFIRTRNLAVFCLDCWRAIYAIRASKPVCIVDYERCSHAVGFYRTFLSWFGQCHSISFEYGRNILSPLLTVHPVEEINQEQLFLKGIAVMPRKQNHTYFENSIPINTAKVIININASNYLLARRYPLDSFAELITLLNGWNTHLEFLLTGTAEESKYVDELVKKLKGLPVQNVSGKWSLEKLTCELMDCALFISGDSGPMHLAAYLSIPTIAIWGPTQPPHFGYEAKKTMAHSTLNLSCSPCLTHPASKPAKACQGKIRCLNKLSSASIFEKAVFSLSAQPATRPIHFPGAILTAHQEEATYQRA